MAQRFAESRRRSGLSLCFWIFSSVGCGDLAAVMARMAKKKTQCAICEELAEQRMRLGREYSRALNQALEARYTHAFARLSESADIAHRKFQRAGNVLQEHLRSESCAVVAARGRGIEVSADLAAAH